MRSDTRQNPGVHEREGARAVAAALGVCVGVSGLDHGFFEALQGNTATPGLLVKAIGPDQRMWIHGTEDAFTLVPNFLATGILSMIVGLLVIVWSIGFVHRPTGSRILLLLGMLMFLVGGGIGMLLFLLFGWATARGIHRPAAWWRSVLPTGTPKPRSRIRRALVALSLALYAFALQIAVTGYVPGVSDSELALYLCWSALLATLAVLALARAATEDGDRAVAEARV
jgi:hypothetical protein